MSQANGNCNGTTPGGERKHRNPKKYQSRASSCFSWGFGVWGLGFGVWGLWVALASCCLILSFSPAGARTGTPGELAVGIDLVGPPPLAPPPRSSLAVLPRCPLPPRVFLVEGAQVELKRCRGRSQELAFAHFTAQPKLRWPVSRVVLSL